MFSGLALAAAAVAAATAAGGAFDGAQWIGVDAASVTERRHDRVGTKCERRQNDRCQTFEGRFEIGGGEIRRAVAHVTGLGFYDLRVNGSSPDGRRMMTPAWTCPEWRVYYDDYDVTALLRRGENRVAVTLAGGYDDSVFEWNWRWQNERRMIFALEVEFEDGTARRFVSDGGWRWTEEGPWAAASLYDGETYDATREFGKARWRSVKTLDEAGLRLVRNFGPPVRRYDPRPPVRIVHLGGGRHLLDFGINRAGVTEIRARLARGTRVTMRHAEELKGNELDETTLRGVRQMETYIAAGTGGVEAYVPRFTYHGYRYVEVTGIDDAQATPENFTGWGVSADLGETAAFECSDATLNWLWAAARRSMRSNFVSYPTDCPMRNERTPCLMDSQAYEDAAFQCFDVGEFYSKWIYDAARYELVADPGAGSNYNPDWAGEPITLAERFLTYLAATNLALREYAELKRTADSFAARSADGLWEREFGDWCAPHLFESPRATGPLCPALVNSALLHEVYRIMARLAALKGETEDAERFAALRERTRTAFLNRFYDPKARRFGKGLAVEQILPLRFGLVPAGETTNAVRALVERIRADGGRLFVGIYGNRYAGDVLCDAGYGDLWLDALRTTEWPSFGFMRADGATTLWEQWERDGIMNSHNHAMFAGVVSTFVTHLAGIRPAADGYAKILVKPCFPKDLAFVRASLETPLGRVSAEWRRQDGKVQYRLTVPDGMEVEFDLPEGTEVVGDLG